MCKSSQQPAAEHKPKQRAVIRLLRKQSNGRIFVRAVLEMARRVESKKEGKFKTIVPEVKGDHIAVAVTRDIKYA